MKRLFLALALAIFLTGCASMQSVVPGLAPTQTPAPSNTAVSTETGLDMSVTNTPSTLRQAQSDTQPAYYVCAGALNVRTGPDDSGPVLGWLVSGQKLTVLLTQDGWGMIETPVPGWVNLKYLCVEGE